MQPINLLFLYTSSQQYSSFLGNMRYLYESMHIFVIMSVGQSDLELSHDCEVIY